MRWPWEKQIDCCYKAQKKLYCGWWEITNINWYYYYQLPGYGPVWDQHGETSRKVHRAWWSNNIKNILRVWFYCLNMIRGNHIYIYDLSVLIQEEGKDSSHCAICWDNVTGNSIHCLLFIFSLNCGLTVKIHWFGIKLVSLYNIYLDLNICIFLKFKHHRKYFHLLAKARRLSRGW